MSLDKIRAEVTSPIWRSTNFLCPILTQLLMTKMKTFGQIPNWMGHRDNRHILSLSWATVTKKINNGQVNNHGHFNITRLNPKPDGTLNCTFK